MQSSREDKVAPYSRARRRLPSGNVFLSAPLCIKKGQGYSPPSDLLSVLVKMLHAANLACKSEEVDKALCIVMVIKITGSKGSDALIIQ